MKKILILLILTVIAYPSYVTFNVDMSQEDVGDEYPTLWMGAFYPDAGFAMTDSDGDDIWSITLDLDPGTYTYKFRNGAWTEWNTGSGWESILGQDCAIGQYSDRQIIVGTADMVIETVCFSSCTSECISITNYDVSFSVDMNNVNDFSISDGVYLQGEFNGWCGICNPMSDDNNDGIYDLTISIPEGEWQYLYTTSGWDGLEGGAPLGSSCDYDPSDEFGNYGFSLSGENIVLDTIPFGACPDGTGSGETSTVTFDIDGVDNCDFVSIAGSFESWSGWGATTDTQMKADVLSGNYEFKVLCVDTDIPEWYNDIWSASEELGPQLGSECDWDPSDEFRNYGFSIGEGTDLTVSYCAGTCDATCDDNSCGCNSLNGDDANNVLDVVMLANCVLSASCDSLSCSCAGDINQDGSYSVLDIVALVSCVINENCGGRIDDATNSQIEFIDNQVIINSDGYIGGVQMTIAHDIDFEIKMTSKAMFSDYITNGNETRLLVIDPYSSHLFDYTNNFEITEIIVANSQDQIKVDLPLLKNYSVSTAYPNPFNPVTQISIGIQEKSEISIVVFNLTGQLIDTIIKGNYSSGNYDFYWRANDINSGIYIIQTQIENDIHTQKVVLIK